MRCHATLWLNVLRWPSWCLTQGVADRSGDPSRDGTYYMKQTVQLQSDEPVGIVISRGRQPETTPRFSAYVWAPGPDDELQAQVKPAA